MNPLYNVPGLGGYLQQRSINEAQPVQQLKEASAVMGLQKVLQEQELAKQAVARKESFRRDLSALGPNPSQEQLASVASKYADDPGKLLDVHQRSLDRQATIEANRDAAKDRALQYQQMLSFRQSDLDRRRDEFAMRRADANERQEFDKWYKAESLRIGQAQSQLNADLKRLGLELNAQRLGQQRTDTANRQVQALGTALERANLPEADAVLRGVEEALKKTPQVAEYLAGPKSLLPDLAVGRDIAAGRQAFQKLFNITLKNRSGAAVTIPEFERLKAEFATGAWKKPEQLAEGVRQARKIISDHYRSVAAGYGPDALQSYNENLRQTGGTPILEPDATAPVAPPGGAPSAPQRLRFDAQGNPLQ